MNDLHCLFLMQRNPQYNLDLTFSVVIGDIDAEGFASLAIISKYPVNVPLLVPGVSVVGGAVKTRSVVKRSESI